MGYGPQEIMNQIMQYLPQADIYNTFCLQQAVSASVVAGTPQTLNINFPGWAAAGLLVGTQIVLSNSIVNNGIIGVTQFIDGLGNSILTFQTAVPHDLTFGYQGSVTLAGFTNPSLNGTQVINNVTDQTHFQIAFPNLPVLNGNEKLQIYIEQGLNGVFSFMPIDPDHISVSIPNSMYLQPGPVAQLIIYYGYNIYYAYDYKTGMDLYAPLPNSHQGFMHIILEDSSASKDPMIESEAYATNKNADMVRTKIINHFSIIVTMSTTGTVTNSAWAEFCWNTLLMSLYQVLVGFDFAQTNNSYITNFIGHGDVEYNKAFYSHAYHFEYVYEMTNDQMFLSNNKNTRSFNQINSGFMPPADTGSNNILVP